MQNNIPTLTIPRKFGSTAIVFYILALFLVTMLYRAYPLPWYYMLSGVVAVVAFFGASRSVILQWNERVMSSKRFEKKLFWTAFLIRVVYMLLIYFIFQNAYGDSYGFENMDALTYDKFGQYIANCIRNGSLDFYHNAVAFLGYEGVDDMGYGTYLGIVYWLTGDSMIVARLLKCLWSALTCVLVYRLGVRNMGESVGRMSGVFCMLWMNFWYYCGCHLKEVEMVFLATLFVEQADQMLRSKQFTAWKVAPVLLLAASLFTFRTALGLVAVLSMLFTVFMSSTKVVSWTKRIIIGLLSLSLIGVSVGNRLKEEANAMISTVQSGQQQQNMEWRAQRKDAGGNVNKFAKYATAAVFAPTILSLPFPTMIHPYEGQNVQKMLHGGNFVKNILSGFLILALFYLLFSGKWREHLLPLSFMLGYVVVLVFSNFAQSERFHQPAMPMEMLFAAYGLSLVVQGVPLRRGLGSKATYRRWFTMWCVVMFVAAIAWNWFKLAGRGLID